MNTEIIDQSGDRSYFYMMPNVVDDIGLTVYAFRLYSHIKRIAGETGVCFQNTTTLADSCKMSEGSVSNAKKELSNAGLISIEEKHNENGVYHEITINDIWAKNIEYYRKQKEERLSNSCDEPPNSPDERPRSPHETKKTPVKKTPVKNILENKEKENQSEPEEDIVEWFRQREIPQPERAHLTADEYKARIGVALEEGIKRAAGMSENDVKVHDYCRGLPADVRDVALVFCTEFGRTPLPSEKGFWIKGFRDLVGVGVSKTNIEQAMRYMRDTGLPISHPGSVRSMAEHHKKYGCFREPKQNQGQSAQQIFEAWKQQHNGAVESSNIIDL